MKRAKIGDAFAVKVPNGYKLYQWAYFIPRKGDYIRVFDGLYETIPENISEIVAGPHSYIVSFEPRKAYRIGLAKMLGSFPVPEEYPIPDYMVAFYPSDVGVGAIVVDAISRDNKPLGDGGWFNVTRMQDIPEEYQNLKLLNNSPTPAWLLYLFDVGFDFDNLDLYYPGAGNSHVMDKYLDIIKGFLDKK